MRTSYRYALLAVFSASLAGLPFVSAAANPPTAPIGMVLQANRSTGDIDVSAQGETIYDGETLTTDGARTLRVQLSGPEMFMRSNSVAEVHKLANGFSANLANGSVVVSTNEGQTFQVFVDGAKIQPAGTAPAIAQITMLTPKELVLTSTKGSLEISMGNEVRTVDPGTSYRVEVQTDGQTAAPQTADPSNPQANPPATPATPPANSSSLPAAAGAGGHFGMVLIVTVAAATGVGVWRALVSPAGL